VEKRRANNDGKEPANPVNQNSQKNFRSSMKSLLENRELI
jgi:hypothetical protein